MARPTSWVSATGSSATKWLRWAAGAALLAALACERAPVPPPRAPAQPAASASAGDAARKAVSFLVVGDWGKDGSPSQRAVAEQMAAAAGSSRAAFVISTGDNFYPKGVTSASDPRFQTTFESVYTGSSLMVPWYVALGNHDYKGEPQAEVDYTQRSARWRMPARYYAFSVPIDDSTRAEFFVLDTSPFVTAYRAEPDYAPHLKGVETAPQLRWLDSALTASTAQWKIAVGHHTIYSASPTHGDTPELIRDVVPLFEKHHVQAYLNGHDHDLQDARAATVAYFTSGGGSETRPAGHDAHTRFSESSIGFLVGELDAKTLRMRFLNDSGRVLYSTTVTR